MLRLVRTNSSNTDFIKLVEMLNADLAIRDGDDHAFYAKLNKTYNLDTVIVAYENNEPVGSGALRPFNDEAIEVKRMYVKPEHRGKGIAKAVLAELERWAKELGHSNTILETGQKQPEAISLYQKSGYIQIPNYGHYDGVYNSVCFKKTL